MPSLRSLLKRKPKSDLAASSTNPFSDPPPSYQYAQATSGPATLSRSARQPAQSSAVSEHSTSYDERDESTLKLFDTVLVIDDSASMQMEQRWDEVRDALKHIAPICTKWDTNGIDIYFLNREQVHENVTDANDVAEIFRHYRKKDLRGCTPIAKRLSDILFPYLRKYRKDPQKQKPLNIICITDGRPTDEPEAYIRYVAEELDEQRAVPWQIGIQFLQVGTDPEAQRYLAGLDDNLHGATADQKKCRDMVDTTHYGKMGEYKNFSDALSKILIGGVNKRWDAKNHEA